MDYFSDEYEEEVKKRGPASYHLVLPYLQKFAFEDVENVPESAFYPPNSCQEHGVYIFKKVPYPHERYKRFLKQIRESNGYDIDCYPPPLLHSPFDRMDLAILSENMCNEITRFAEFAIDEINAAEKRKRYRLVRVEKAVDSDIHMCYLLTSSVKDVDDASSDKILRAMVTYTLGANVKCTLNEWSFIPTLPTPDPDEFKKYSGGYGVQGLSKDKFDDYMKGPGEDDDIDEDDENIEEDA